MAFQIIKNPITRKRLLRFKAIKRAYFSFWILLILYLFSLSSELICNGNPLYVRFNGNSYFPVFKFYPEDLFMKNSKNTRPDYRKVNQSETFKRNTSNFMVFPFFSFGPYESIDQASIAVSKDVTVYFDPIPMVGNVNIKKDYKIERSNSFGIFVKKNENYIKGLIITDFFDLPKIIKEAIEKRFENKESPQVSYDDKMANGIKVIISIPPFSPRKNPPETVRLMFRESFTKDKDLIKLVFNKQNEIIKKNSTIWSDISDYDKDLIFSCIQKRFLGPIDTLTISIKGRFYTIFFKKEEINFPYPPTKDHFMGIDSAGRDVFARILYGFRTSLTFGLLLVIFSIVIGIIIGAVQGYYGGVIDMTGQRLIEIWSALPFLYIMILMGSIYGRGFILLLIIYAIFNWIGISYYIRAEFLRLRKQQFVEAAKCMGISSAKVIFKHILPNALVPVITFFPFYLVGAIGSLAALDYLGFGLPPPTASWGELLYQAQEYRWAWWLILYPSLALFAVMLLGVFIGEGVRDAYDPKKYTRLE